MRAATIREDPALPAWLSLRALMQATWELRQVAVAPSSASHELRGLTAALADHFPGIQGVTVEAVIEDVASLLNEVLGLVCGPPQTRTQEALLCWKLALDGLSVAAIGHAWSRKIGGIPIDRKTIVERMWLSQRIESRLVTAAAWPAYKDLTQRLREKYRSTVITLAKDADSYTIHMQYMAEQHRSLETSDALSKRRDLVARLMAAYVVRDPIDLTRDPTAPQARPGEEVQSIALEAFPYLMERAHWPWWGTVFALRARASECRDIYWVSQTPSGEFEVYRSVSPATEPGVVTFGVLERVPDDDVEDIIETIRAATVERHHLIEGTAS